VIVTAIETNKILPSRQTIFDVLDKSINSLAEGCIVVISSKIVSLCEGRVVDDSADIEELIKQEADFYLSKGIKGHGHRTIIRNTLI